MFWVAETRNNEKRLRHKKWAWHKANLLIPSPFIRLLFRKKNLNFIKFTRSDYELRLLPSRNTVF